MAKVHPDTIYLRKVHPAPDSPTTLKKRVDDYMKARDGKQDLTETRDHIIDHLMNERKMKTYADLTAPVHNRRTLFELAVQWNDIRLLRAILSTARRLGVTSQLQHKYPGWEAQTSEMDELLRDWEYKGKRKKRTRRRKIDLTTTRGRRYRHGYRRVN